MELLSHWLENKDRPYRLLWLADYDASSRFRDRGQSHNHSYFSGEPNLDLSARLLLHVHSKYQLSYYHHLQSHRCCRKAFHEARQNVALFEFHSPGGVVPLHRNLYGLCVLWKRSEDETVAGKESLMLPHKIHINLGHSHLK